MFWRRRRDDRADAPTAGPPAAALPAGVDLNRLSARWKRLVEEAVAARAGFLSFLSDVAPGPLRERMDELARVVDAAVVATYEAADRAQRLETTRSQLAEQEATARLKAARRELERVRQSQPAEVPTMEARVDALAAQHAAFHRVWNALEETERQLRLLDARLDAVVARAAELALTAGGAANLDAVASDLATVVGELGALRAGLEELA